MTLATVSFSTQTTTERYTSSEEPSTKTFTTFINQTPTKTIVLTQSTNGPPFASVIIIGLLLAISTLAVYILLHSRTHAVPVAPQPAVDHTAIETIDGIVLKYVNDRSGEISISSACGDLGISERQLRDSIQRLIDKGVLIR
jgi:hypothetical protein